MSKPSNNNLLIYVLTALALIIAAGFYLNYPSNHSSTINPIQTSSQHATEHYFLALTVEPDFAVPSIHRLGLNLSDLAFYGPDKEDTTPHPSQANSKVKQDIDVLKSINPSYLRYELDPLAQNLPQNIATENNLYDAESQVTSSLPDFLNLCSLVGANPWIALTSNLGEADLDALGHYLAQHADIQTFSNVIIEFQDAAFQGLSNSEEASQGTSSELHNDPAFSIISHAAGPEVHLTAFLATSSNNHFINGGLSETALAQSFLKKLLDHPQPLIVFDIALKNRLPTQNVKTASLLNQVLGGSLHLIHPQALQNGTAAKDAEQLSMAAFRSGSDWTAAIASARNHPVTLAIEFPEDGRRLPSSVSILQYTSQPVDSLKNNEQNQLLQFDNRKVTINVPANSFVILNQ